MRPEAILYFLMEEVRFNSFFLAMAMPGDEGACAWESTKMEWGTAIGIIGNKIDIPSRENDTNRDRLQCS